MSKRKSPNDQRSDTKNPNNPAHSADQANRVKQQQGQESHTGEGRSKRDSRTATSVISVDLVAAALCSEELCHVPLEVLQQDAEDYARFLLLIRTNWHTAVAPTKAIDRMWHLHMLHPKAYYTDCMRLFDEILEHDGGFGATAEEAPVLDQTFRLTASLWQETYGTPYLGAAVACKRNCVSRCQRRCKTVECAA